MICWKGVSDKNRFEETCAFSVDDHMYSLKEISTKIKEEFKLLSWTLLFSQKLTEEEYECFIS